MSEAPASPRQWPIALRAFLVVTLGSILVGVLIGTVQHYVAFGVWGYGFGRGPLLLACFEGGSVGGLIALPTGLIAYYGLLKKIVTARDTVLIVLGSLAFGCLAGIALFWFSAFLTPFATFFISRFIRLRRHSGQLAA